MSAGTWFPGTPDPIHFWPGAGEIRIAGDSWGDPNGPLVLLQRGRGQTRRAWNGAGEKLGAEGYHAIAFEAHGHGDSDWAPDGPYGEDVMVEDLRWDELLNGGLFHGVRELRVIVADWVRHYNAVRPHSSLGYRPPAPQAWLTMPAEHQILPSWRPSIEAGGTLSTSGPNLRAAQGHHTTQPASLSFADIVPSIRTVGKNRV